jgi:hypothetical protein
MTLKLCLAGVLIICAVGAGVDSYAAGPKKEPAGRAAMTTEVPAPEQQQVVLDPLEEVRAELRTGKTAVLARIMQFKSDAEAAKFWPIYRQYQTDFAAISDRRIAIAKDYMANFRTMDDATAKDLMNRSLKTQSDTIKLRQQYADTISSEISPMVAASFLQIEGLLQEVIDLDVRSNLPLLADRLTASNKAQIEGIPEYR